MSQEAILNIVLSTVVAITAIFALFQTHKQIKISNKQFLFNRRLDKYLLAKSLIELYKDNINLLDYKDNKDASAGPFNRTITVSAIQELYYWSSVDDIYENNYTVENKPNWNTYTYKSNTYSINFNNQGEDKYIFFVTSSDIPETKFFIYSHGSSPTLSGGIKKIGIITIQLYNIPLNYYLYRTNNVLGGDYDIKW